MKFDLASITSTIVSALNLCSDFQQTTSLELQKRQLYICHHDLLELTLTCLPDRAHSHYLSNIHPTSGANTLLLFRAIR